MIKCLNLSNEPDWTEDEERDEGWFGPSPEPWDFDGSISEGWD